MSEDSIIKASSDLDMGLIGDHRNLNKLRSLGRQDKRSQALALKACAEQFQSLLNQYWVNAMRQSNDTINPDSPLHSKYSSFYEDMLSEQNVAAMTKNSAVNKHSITYLITKQFAKSLGDEGKELLKELDQMSVSNSHSYIKGSNVMSNFNQFVQAKVDSQNSISNLSKLYNDLPNPNTMHSFASQEEFVQKMMPYAIKAVEGLGFNPLVLVAQAALETGWGEHVGSSNNFYGIKANSSWSGDKQSLTTKEFENGRFVDVQANFRKYSDVLESMRDYIKFIKENPRYQNAADKSYNVDDYFEQIQQAGYATDPNYADKLKKISRKIAFMAYK